MRKILTLFIMLMLSGVLAFAQNRVVTGTVTDNKGVPIEGASVRIKGSRTGIATDAGGNFSISVSPGATLVFSGVGITPQEVAVGDQSTVNVSLTTTETELTNVVVTAFGQTRQAKELGYATAKVSTKELTQAKVTDISTGLEGKVSGLQVNLTDNGVNPSTRIVLRGNRSLTGNNQALLVVDVVPLDDASYLPKLQQRCGGYGGEGGSFINHNGTVNAVPFENESYGPAYDGSKILLALSPVFAPDGTTVQSYDSLFTTYSAKPNELKNFFNKGLTNQFDVNFSTGDEHGTFYMGFQDVNVAGVVPNDVSRRDNIRIGGTREYGRFKADYTFSYNQANIDVAGLSYNQTTGGVFSGRQLYFELLNTASYIPISLFKDPNGKWGNPNSYYNAYATNPYWTIDNSRRKTTNYDVLANINLSYKIADSLTVSDRLGVTQTTQQLKYTRAGITFAPWAIADPQGAGNVPSSQKSLSPSSYDQTLMEQRINNDLIGSFNKDFSDFSLKVFVGFNVQQRYQRFVSLQGDNLQFPGDYNIGSVLGVPTYNEGSYKQREYSIFEDATLGYREYLFLHVSNRDEWNSILAPSQQHFEYPGADLSFVFTQAINSLKNNKILSYGKIRGGISQVANINLGGNPYGAYSLVNPDRKSTRLNS